VRPGSNPALLRVVALADTDSYVKWAAALLGSRADAVTPSLLVVQTPLVVSDSQLAAALAGSGLDDRVVRRIDYAALLAALRAQKPDAVLIAARGPLVRVLARLVATLEPRPVIVTGLPGISIPATRKALFYRTQCDLFVLHSLREVREFTALAARLGLSQRFALSRLPFAQVGAAARVQHPDFGGTDLVFAAQAIVPRERRDRDRVVRMLRDAARADPTRRVVVKVRAMAGERQTHHERDDYAGLIAELGEVPDNLVLSSAPMARALDSAEGLVTVSSTAAIEAVARGIPVVALDTFGVDEALINTVFEGSGLFGGEGRAIARDFSHPRPEWLCENYFHASSEDDWVERLAALTVLRHRGRLPGREPLARRGGALRDAFERKQVLGREDRTLSGALAFAIGTPVRAVLLLLRGMRRPVHAAHS
jgi:hypothetical protein